MDGDEHDDDHERALRRQVKEAHESLKKTGDTMMNSMIEAMAPMLAESTLLSDEARAWDNYVCAFLPRANGDAEAIGFADKLLDARRQRFNDESFKERMRGMLPSGRGLCNKPILRDSGADTGHRCAQNEGHKGTCF